MFHMQTAVDDWPQAMARTPMGTLFLTVDQASMNLEAKAYNPNSITCLRHWNDAMQHYQGTWNSGWFDWDTATELAREWFRTHVDGTFIDEYAPYTDLVTWHNEIWADSQNMIEVQERIKATEAAIHVWNNEYRPMLQQESGKDIKLVIGKAAVGNNMPPRIGQLGVLEDCPVAYHPYTHWSNYSGERMRAANDWVDLSGRWETMERAWGLKPEWIFTEAGPFEGAETGWLSSPCLGGDFNLYLEAMAEWIDDMRHTAAYAEGRILGWALFSCNLQSDQFNTYKLFTEQLVPLADQMTGMWNPGTGGPPIPPPQPPPNSDEQQAWNVTVDMQVTGQGGLRLNAGAAIQQQVARDNEGSNLYLQIVTDEYHLNGKTYQAAESLTGACARRVYVWHPVEVMYWYEDPNGNFHSAPDINLSQRDVRWASETIGESTGHTKTIGNWGCLLVVYNMLARDYKLTNMLPDAYNTHMLLSGSFNGPYLISGAFLKAHPDDVIYENWITRDNPEMIDKINDYLLSGRTVPARVDFRPSTASWEQHWVLLLVPKGVDDYLMVDPWTGEQGLLSESYGISGTDVLEALFYRLK